MEFPINRFGALLKPTRLPEPIAGDGWVSASAYYTFAGDDLEREVLHMCQEDSLGVMVWSPLAGGLLGGKFERNSDGTEGAR